jgi:hypothetical protein
MLRFFNILHRPLSDKFICSASQIFLRPSLCNCLLSISPMCISISVFSIIINSEKMFVPVSCILLQMRLRFSAQESVEAVR